MTRLLHAWSEGDPRAQEDLLPLVYGELRRRAAGYLRHERRNQTLQPTALVHEAYLRLIGQRQVDWRSRMHFSALSSEIMRRVLVDHARIRGARKRPDEALRVSLEPDIASASPPTRDVLMLDRALTDLARIDPRQSRIVELAHFGGLSEAEVADVVSASRSTVARELRSAKAWLYQRMTAGTRQEPA